jgi:CheY-like chemotaxis protein
MGLAMVHSIVLNHGGAITVESAPGQGTTFEIYLPCSKGVVGISARLEEAVPSGHHECILFVDDEIALTHLGQAMLDRLGYRAVVRTSAAEALQLFRAAPHQFDLVITDQTMPQMTGETFVRELRGIRPDIPVILCTGFSHTMTAEKARALGIDALLMKPLVTGDLGRAIHRVLMPRAA